MSDGLPRSSADIAAARAEVARQLAPLQRKDELLRQMAEIAKEWDHLDGAVTTAQAGIPDAGTKNGVPVKMSQRAKIILQEKPGQYIILREIWQGAVDRGKRALLCASRFAAWRHVTTPLRVWTDPQRTPIDGCRQERLSQAATVPRTGCGGRGYRCGERVWPLTC
jgi:hypothetical protein